MKVLVACEESQEVCKAFRVLGHEAYSCDIQDCSGGHPEWHIKGDALEVIKQKWDLIIAHPPCTDLAVSGARWFKEKQADGRQQKSIDFFMEFINADCPRIAVENPVCIMSTIYRKPDQIIQPYEYGHPTKKTTCLWLKGLPKLKPTNIVEPETEEFLYSNGQLKKYGKGIGEAVYNGKILAWNDPMTAKIRSKTFSGIAKAMAEQWGCF